MQKTFCELGEILVVEKRGAMLDERAQGVDVQPQLEWISDRPARGEKQISDCVFMIAPIGAMLQRLRA